MAPVWITMLNTFQRSSLAPSSSPARIRCPVLEIGRDSVRASTVPSMPALRRMARSIFSLLSEKRGYGLPERRHAIRTIVAGFGQQDPFLGPGPGVEEPPGVLGRDDLVVPGGDAKKRRRHPRRKLDRREPVAQEKIHRQVPEMAL